LIINHKYKFCFFQIPRTGSTAIANELLEFYESEQILHKHSNYDQFLSNATNQEREYFKFAGIRNPLDSIVSQFLKMKNDYDRKFARGIFGSGKPISDGALAKYHFIQSTNASFEDFFKKFVTPEFFKPHQETTISHMDFIIRFDKLQDDFTKLTTLLDIPTIKIPVINATKHKDQEYQNYYTGELIPIAIDILSPVMDKYNFSFPEEWI
jgi:hypothetical protein|tara:strand:- start:596 stop:1225 length:630 start_codon:yes stop_codon:yes gene_type:complete